jgi:nicotinamidase-related amidase
MDLFHKAELPVIVIRHVASGDGVKFDNVKELHVNDSDIEIKKVYGNSFWKTDLEKILRDLGVEFLVLCGNVAENCVNATYVGALERDFIPTLLQNGVFARREEFLLSHFYARELISCSALEAMVGFEL